jgi:hypothetical protein
MAPKRLSCLPFWQALFIEMLLKAATSQSNAFKSISSKSACHFGRLLLASNLPWLLKSFNQNRSTSCRHLIAKCPHTDLETFGIPKNHS